MEEGDVYVDAVGHMSGRDESRPAWQAMRRRIVQDGSVVALIVESLSRPSRTVRSFLEFVEELAEREITLVSLKERFDTSTAMGRAMLMFIAVVNQLESDLASERMSANIGYKKAHGRHWGLTPFGCARMAGGSGALVPSDETYGENGSERRYYDGLVRCYEVYALDHHSFDALADLLNGEGWRFRARDGEPRRWTGDVVRGVVAMNRVYEGWVPASGPVKDKPELWVRANYEPVVPVGLCQSVARVWERRAEEVHHPTPARGHGSEYTLTGVLRCARCGELLKGERGTGGERRYRHARAHSGCCPDRQLAEPLEAQAIELLRALVLPESVCELVVGLMVPEDLSAERERAAALRQEVARREAEIERLVELVVGGDLDAVSHRRIMARRSTEVEALRVELTECESGLVRERMGAHAVFERVRGFASVVAGASPAVQRQVIAAVFERLDAEAGEIKGAAPREWCRPFLASGEGR